ncbi:MAG TPA: hypothetical protein VJZ27_07370 [Aggregatilineales bacterium]|nr:hypothetical protein [Aggregatilineales bacterium]
MNKISGRTAVRPYKNNDDFTQGEVTEGTSCGRGSAAIGSGEGLRPKTFFKPFKRKSYLYE